MYRLRRIASGKKTARITSPATGAYATSLTPTITWRGDGTVYELEIARTLTGTPTVTGINALSYAIETPLTIDDDPYLVRVRPAGGEWSSPVRLYADLRTLDADVWYWYAGDATIDRDGTLAVADEGDPVGCIPMHYDATLKMRIPSDTSSLKPSYKPDWYGSNAAFISDGVDDYLEVLHEDIGTLNSVPMVYALGEFPSMTPNDMYLFQKHDDYFAQTFNNKVICSLNGADLIGEVNVNFSNRTSPLWIRLTASDTTASYTARPIINAGVNYVSTASCNAGGRYTNNLKVGFGTKFSRLIIFPTQLSAGSQAALEAYCTLKTGITF